MFVTNKIDSPYSKPCVVCTGLLILWQVANRDASATPSPKILYDERMTQVTAAILDLLRNGWTALAGGLAAMILLAFLAQTLRTTAASAIGARFWVWEALSAGMSLLILALIAFLGVPAIVQAAQSSVPGSGGCGPVSDLSVLASAFIGALAAVRIMAAFYTSAVSAAMGGSASLSGALIHAGEVIFGMLIAAAAIPIATHFLGVC